MLDIIILAAGKGKRMSSNLPKVLMQLAGTSLLKRIIDTSRAVGADHIHVIHGHCSDRLRAAITENHIDWVKQEEQLGTGHAVAQALPHVSQDAQVLILPGDVPLIQVDTLKKLIANLSSNGLSLLTAEFDNPTGYGRILRNDKGEIMGIVEERDASDLQRAIREVNTSIMCVPASFLKRWLHDLKRDNAQGEYYLTDIVAMAVAEKIPVESVKVTDIEEVLGVNDRKQLATLERCYQRKQANRLLQEGVTLMDPARIDVRGELIVAHDVVIDINVIFEGRVVLGEGCMIGPNCVLRDVILGKHVEVKANSILEESIIGDQCVIGPFARLRPGTELASEVHIGNFVELKKSKVDTGSKINHLSYIGDATIGTSVNIGAGTITCNYDGVHKHPTTIGSGAFIGSGTELVAPVSIGEGAYIGAGSTIDHDAPAGELTLARARQVTLLEWKNKKKK